MLVAHESQHYIAIQENQKQFHLVKYSKKKKEFQIKKFGFSDFERADFYMDGRRFYSIDPTKPTDKKFELEAKDAERNVLSVRMFIKGIEYPYIMTIDQLAEGSGALLSNVKLVNNSNKWHQAFTFIVKWKEDYNNIYEGK